MDVRVNLTARNCQLVVSLKATTRPAVRALDGCLLVAAGVHERGELVERHHDVGAQRVLNTHGHLRREAVLGAVDVRAESHAVLVDERVALFALGDDVVFLHAGDVHREGLFKACAEAEHLESAGVGVCRAVPVGELCQPAGLVDDFLAGLQVQVVRVRQHRLRAGGSHLLGRERLHGRFRADRNERRRSNIAMRGVDGASTSARAFDLLYDVKARRPRLRHEAPWLWSSANALRLPGCYSQVTQRCHFPRVGQRFPGPTRRGYDVALPLRVLRASSVPQP